MSGGFRKIRGGGPGATAGSISRRGLRAPRRHSGSAAPSDSPPRRSDGVFAGRLPGEPPPVALRRFGRGFEQSERKVRGCSRSTIRRRLAASSPSPWPWPSASTGPTAAPTSSPSAGRCARATSRRCGHRRQAIETRRGPVRHRSLPSGRGVQTSHHRPRFGLAVAPCSHISCFAEDFLLDSTLSCYTLASILLKIPFCTRYRTISIA